MLHFSSRLHNLHRVLGFCCMLESSSKHFLGSLVLAFLCCLMVETSPHDSSIDAGAHIAELKHLAHCMAVRLLCLHRQHEKREKEQQQQEEGTHQGSFPPRCVFSDLDGTLLHFGGNLLKESYEILPFDGAEKEALSIFKDIGRREMAGGQPSTQHEEECAAVSLGPLWGPAPPSQATCLHSSSELSADSQVPSPPASSSPPAPPCVGRTGSSAPAPRYVTLRYQPDGTTRTCIELPSLSSGPGYISVRTLELVQAIRREGCLFVLLTGARSSTYLMRRRTGLPVVDYECIEGGGRLIHDPNARLDLASDAHSEGHEGWDRTWKEAVGPLQGLWGLYEELKGEGWGVDGRDYYTSFRVDTRGKMGEQWEGVKSR